MPKVSVIVPMYNAEDTICRCLDSILASTVDFEILLIDDGSNDKTAMICDEYKKKNANIYVYNQIRGESQGQEMWGLTMREEDILRLLIVMMKCNQKC